MKIEEIEAKESELKSGIETIVKSAQEADAKHRQFMSETQAKVNEINAELLRLEGRKSQINGD